MINSKSFTLISTETEILGLEDIVTVYQECKYCTKIMFLYTKSIPSLNLKYLVFQTGTFLTGTFHTILTHSNQNRYY